MNEKNKEERILNDEDFIELEDPDNYYIDEETGLAFKETYTKEDEDFDAAYDVSQFYLEYELTDEEVDAFETILKAADINCPMSLQYYLSILDKIRHYY